MISRTAGSWTKAYQPTFPVNGKLPPGRMSYWLYLPASAGPDPLPLVVMLHGCGQTAEEFARGTRMNLLAERKGFAVLYPQQSTLSHPNRCWHWYEKATQEGGGDVKIIASLIETVVKSHRLDRSRIYVAGISAGASMANIVALNHPELIAAVGMHSAAVFGAGHSSMGAYAVMQGGAINTVNSAIRDVVEKYGVFPKMPAILIHGQRDPFVRSINLAHVAEQFRTLNDLSSAGSPPVITAHAPRVGGNGYQTFDYYDRRKLMLRVCEIFHLEHAWSGGDCTLQFNACEGPNASLLMWEFFAKHRRVSVNPALQVTAARARQA